MTGPYTAKLPRWKTKIIHLVPVRSGWAVIGSPGKYLSPAACRVLKHSPEEMVVRLRESESFLVWSENGSPTVRGAKVTQVDGKLYRVELPPTAKAVTCTVSAGQ